MNGIIVFAIVNLINVIISTVKSLFTVKGGKFSASIVNAICFGFYTYVIIFTANGDINIHLKACIVAMVNLIGVYLVKFIEEKMKKDKLWIFNATIKRDSEVIRGIVKILKEMEIQLIYNEIVKDELYILQIFSKNQKESEMITSILNNYKVKYYAIESKIS